LSERGRGVENFFSKLRHRCRNG